MGFHNQSVSKILDSSQALLHLTTVEYISMLLVSGKYIDPITP